MNIKLKHIALGALMCVTFTNAQEKQIKKASDTFNNYAFMDAIGSYESLVKKGYTEQQIYQNLGNANYLNAAYEAASDWYGKLHQLTDYQMSSNELYQYAQSLKSLERYAESDALMEQLEADGRGTKFTDARDYLAQIEKQSGRYEIKNLSVNSKESDYGPSFLAEQLIFVTARDTGLVQNNIHKWNNKSFSNIYKARLNSTDQYVEATSFSKELNTKAHESSMVFTKDGKTVYFTRNNDTKGDFTRDKSGVTRLKLYRAELENGSWSNTTVLPFNNDAYSVAHPALSPDEDLLYFASDMEGSLGASDIFVVDINADGSYGTPKNLGSSINTEGRETFPFVSEDNVLYFASDGHPGLGGLDVFATDLSIENDAYEIVNVGKPVNGKMDDFSYIINSTSQKGFFASNREGGVGDDDIYRFEQTKPLKFKCNSSLSGIVKNTENGSVLPNALVQLFDSDGKEIAQMLADSEGKFSLPFDCAQSELTAVATLDEFAEGRKIFVPTKEVMSITLQLEPEKRLVAAGEDVGKYLNLPMIYFNFDKSDIRSDAQLELDKVVAFMNQYPDVKIEVGSHTDSRSTDAYNLSLSERRAQATRKYLIQMGVDGARILAKGYGETQLTNDCGNVIEIAIECGEAQHELNRRSEFIIVE